MEKLPIDWLNVVVGIGKLSGNERTSLLPRPKPFITGPRSLRGKGDWGVSGPAMGSRAPVGRTMVLIWAVRCVVSKFAPSGWVIEGLVGVGQRRERNLGRSDK
jgi:hypothetical protein